MKCFPGKKVNLHLFRVNTKRTEKSIRVMKMSLLTRKSLYEFLSLSYWFDCTGSTVLAVTESRQKPKKTHKLNKTWKKTKQKKKKKQTNKQKTNQQQLKIGCPKGTCVGYNVATHFFLIIFIETKQTYTILTLIT